MGTILKEYLHAPLYQNKVADFPQHLDLETSSACNFSCSYCPQSMDDPGFKHGRMDKEDAKKIIKYFADNGTKTIKLFWRGEPSLDKNLPELLKYSQECGLFTMLNSNGSFPHKNENEVAKYTDWISFSIDHYHKPKNGEHNLNPAYLAVASFFKSRGVITQIQTGTPTKELEDFCKENHIDYKPDIITKRTDSNDYSYTALNPVLRKDCGFANWRMIISHDLFIHTCCVAWGQDELNMGKVDINDLDSIKRIWNGKRYNNLREDQKTLKFRESPCVTCVSPSAYKL